MHYYRIRARVIVLCCLVNVSVSLGQPLLWYTFDDGDMQVVQDNSSNDIDGRIFGNVQYVDGVNGKAMHFDGQTGYVLLPESKHLQINGDMTIEVWLRPEDTDKFIDDRLIIGHTAPHAINRNYYLFISKYARYSGLLRFDHGDGEQDEIIMTDLPPFTGQWQHIAYVAEYPYEYFYIDGQLVKRQQMFIDITAVPIGGYSVGGWSKDAGGYGFYKGAMDDLKLYDRALSRMDIAETARVADTVTPTLDINSTLSHINKQLSIEVFADGLGSSATTLRCRVLPAGTTDTEDIIEVSQAITHTRPRSGRTLATMKIDMEQMKAGTYQITADVLDGQGNMLVQATREHPSMGTPDWWNSQAGITDQVPEPWTPVTVNSGSDNKATDVGVWGRTYRFAGFFPEQITTKGADILDSPMQLMIRTSEGPVDIPAGKPTIVQQTPAAVTLEVTGHKDGMTLSARHIIEYDGLIKTTWSIAADKPVTLKELLFDLPLKSAHAVYHYNSDYYDHFFGTPAQPKPIHPTGLLAEGVVTRPFTPMLSFLDDDRGIQWVCESRRNWRNRDALQAIRIHKNARRAVVQFRLVDTPVELKPDAPLDYTFGFMVGPIKPMGADAWTHRFTGDGFGLYGNAYNWPEVQVNGMPVYEYYKTQEYKVIIVQGLNKIMGARAPIGDEIPKMHELMAEVHRNDLWAIPYFGYQISEISPEWPDFGMDVVNIPRIRNADSYPGWTPQYVNAVCLDSYWSDYFIDVITGMMDDLGVDGVYLDTTTVPHACKNTTHGCGYYDENGELQPTYPVFGIRDTLQRLYVEIKKRNPDAVIDIHASRSLMMPALAYATTLWSGEQLSNGGVIENPLDRLPLDRFRAEFLGAPWGLPSDLLQFNLSPYGTSLGYALLHDIPARPVGIYVTYPDAFARTAKLLEEFGRLDATWLPYWKNSEYVTTSSPDIYVSLYRHPDNGVLAVVMNLSEHSRTAQITLNYKTLGLPESAKAIDMYSKTEIPIIDNTIEQTMNPFAWTMIRIQ